MSTSPSSFQGPERARPDRSKTMFPDLTRDDVFRLETRRLWLRWPRLADVQAIVRLAGEKAVAEMTARIPHPYRPGGCRAVRLPWPGKSNADGEGLQLAITPKGRPNSLIGVVGIGPSPDEGTPHLGFWLGTPSWGQGHATEAARALIDAFFAYGDGTRDHGLVRVINPASRRVLEKCGFAYQGSGLVRAAGPRRPLSGGTFPARSPRLGEPEDLGP